MFEILKMLDRDLLLKINSTHTVLLDNTMWFMSYTWPTVLILLVTAYVFYRKYSLKKAAEFVLGCAIVFACTDFSTNVIKHSVKRYRPTHNLEIKNQIHVVNDYHGGVYGFFSSHAANTFGIMTFIFLCVKWVPKKYRLFFFLYPLVVVYSRIYLGVHYPSDILVGTGSGFFFGWLVYRIMNRYFLHLDAQEV